LIFDELCVKFNTGAIDRGLNFEEALTDPEYIKMEAAAQVSEMSTIQNSLHGGLHGNFLKTLNHFKSL
jgi:hypothetical protein